MGTFLYPPTFQPAAYNIPANLPIGYVLTLTASGPRFQAAGGGSGGGVGAYLKNAPAAGTFNNFNPSGFGSTIGRLDIDTTAGNVILTGLIATVDAQLLIIANIGANLLTLDGLNAGSSAANRFRLPGNLVLIQNDSQLFCYYGGTVTKWCKA